MTDAARAAKGQCCRRYHQHPLAKYPIAFCVRDAGHDGRHETFSGERWEDGDARDGGSDSAAIRGRPTRPAAGAAGR